MAWTLADGTTTYALEGAIFVTGAAVQWLRDGLGHHRRCGRGRSARRVSVADSGGVVLVPAFVGLGSPWWDPYARGTVAGITRGTTAPTSPEPWSRRWPTRPATWSRRWPAAAGREVRDLRVDGGAAAMDLLLQLQADQLGVTVRRPVDQETTALGAAYLAGLAEGVWGSLDDVGRGLAAGGRVHTGARTGRPLTPGTRCGCAAVERSRGWASG